MKYKYGAPLDVQVTVKVTDDINFGLEVEAKQLGKTEAEVLQEFMLSLHQKHNLAYRLYKAREESNENKINKVYE
jgi:hypothetical protein